MVVGAGVSSGRGIGVVGGVVVMGAEVVVVVVSFGHKSGLETVSPD